MSPTNFFGLDGEDDFKEWTLADIYDDLASKSDICQALDIGVHRFVQWTMRRDRIGCPHPIKRIGPTDVYSLQEWKDWYARWTDPSRKGRRYDSKWIQTRPYGSGKSFFTTYNKNQSK